MMRVLAIDTSNQTMSIAVKDGDFIVGEVTTHIKRNHSERLMPAISELLKDVNWTPSDLDRIVVAQGPGSYTGLRIGITIAKTLAWTLGKELVGLSSLEVLAGNREESPHYIVPFFDARRENLYTGLYKNTKNGLEAVIPDQHISAKDWIKELVKLEGTFELVSPDIGKYQAMFVEELESRLAPVPMKDHLPKAGVLADLGERKAPQDAHTFAPIYLKLAEAEEIWQEQNPDEVGGDYIEKI